MTRPGTFRLPPSGVVAAAAVLTLVLPAARAAFNVPSDGSDGAFNPTSRVQVDLSEAAIGHWNDNNAAHAGKGVYDPDKWAVVFKYSSVNIPAGVTVTFKNHSPNAPVVWLVQGDVNIAGDVDVSGNFSYRRRGGVEEGGPGGFRGGFGGFEVNRGFGPGGADDHGFASFGRRGDDASTAHTYGSATLNPLIGGSGSRSMYGDEAKEPGEGGDSYYNGGSGGGAILIAAGGSISVSGRIRADGGGNPDVATGSGGAIRLLADTINAAPDAEVSANAYKSGAGRIRVEMNKGSFRAGCAPVASFAPAGASPTIWPPETQPRITITKIGNIAAPSDPAARLDYPNQDINLPGTAPVAVTLQASNVPLNWKVSVRATPYSGQGSEVEATFKSGDLASSVWQAMITPAEGFTALQARAYKP